MNGFVVYAFTLVIFTAILGFLTLCIFLISEFINIKSKRPILITAFCIYIAIQIFNYFVHTGIVFPQSTFQISKISDLVIHPILDLFIIIGLWKMKKWGLATLFVKTVILELILLQSGSWGLFSLLLFVPLAVPFYYHKNFK